MRPLEVLGPFDYTFTRSPRPRRRSMWLGHQRPVGTESLLTAALEFGVVARRKPVRYSAVTLFVPAMVTNFLRPVTPT